MKTTSMNEIDLSAKKRRRLSNIFDTTVAVLMILFGTCETAFAYIDPGSGSVIITAILGFLGAISYTFRKAFYRFRSQLLRKAPEDECPQKKPE